MFGAQVALGMIQGRRATIDTSQARGVSGGMAAQSTVTPMDMRDAHEGSEDMVAPKGPAIGRGRHELANMESSPSRMTAVHRRGADQMANAIANITTRGLRGGRSAYIQMNGSGYRRRGNPSPLRAARPTNGLIRPYTPNLGQSVRVDRDHRPPYMDRLMADQEMLRML